MLTWMSILLWFICMVFIYNTIFWKQTIHINHNNILIQVSMLMLISYIFLQNTCTGGRCTSFEYSWWWALAPETCKSDPAEIKPAQCCIKLVFHLTYTMMHWSTKLKLFNSIIFQFFLIKKRKMLNMLFPNSESSLLLFHHFLSFHRTMSGL